MTKEILVKMRDTLKAGKNLPLRIFVNNNHRVIDESSVYEFVKWDDDNEILYVYSLTDMQSATCPSNKGGELSLFALHYEFIEGLEVARLPYKELENSINSLVNIGGVKFTDNTKQHILDMFKAALSTTTANMYPEYINKAMGIHDGNKAVNDNDSYYNNRYREAFKETRYPVQCNNNIKKENP